MRDAPPDEEPQAPRGGASLREALRRARAEAAERTDAVVDLRQLEVARLERLKDALAPVFEQVPEEIDLFDVGLVPGARPRLFVDMVSFVEMGRDRHTYRFLRDGRHGRSVAAESEHVEPIVAAITDYVARRLVERERLLADEDLARPAAPASRPAVPPSSTGGGSAAEAEAAEPTRRGRAIRILAILGAFVVGGGVGGALIVALMVAAAKGLLPGVG